MTARLDSRMERRLSTEVMGVSGQDANVVGALRQRGSTVGAWLCRLMCFEKKWLWLTGYN